MIRFLPLLCIFFTSAVFAQVGQPDSLLPYTVTLEQEVRTDSFVFVGKSYALPRKCNRKNQSNCCSYRSNPDQVGCYDGTTMSWSYIPNEEIAKMNVESLVAQSEKQMKKFIATQRTFYVMGKEVTGYQISYETMEGTLGNRIITSGVVDGQAVLIDMLSAIPLKKNKDIQSVFRQIIRLKE